MQQLISAEQLAWEADRPTAITSDAIWQLDVYRAALFLLHISRADCRAMRTAHSAFAIADQLTKAAASVSANIGEGYSRSTRADRLRFFDYALGSARECIAWYEAARDVLPDPVVDERLHLLARIRSLVLGLIRYTRTRKLSSGRFEP